MPIKIRHIIPFPFANGSGVPKSSSLSPHRVASMRNPSRTLIISTFFGRSSLLYFQTREREGWNIILGCIRRKELSVNGLDHLFLLLCVFIYRLEKENYIESIHIIMYFSICFLYIDYQNYI